jgi:hypothetical protein
MTSILPEPFGPEYPRELGATVQKYRRLAKNSIFDLDKPWRDLWADAIEKSIKAKQRAALLGQGSPPVRPCPIGDARREHLRNALLAYPAKVRRERTPEAWQEMYDEAMEQKRQPKMQKAA